MHELTEFGWGLAESAVVLTGLLAAWGLGVLIDRFTDPRARAYRADARWRRAVARQGRADARSMGDGLTWTVHRKDTGPRRLR